MAYQHWTFYCYHFFLVINIIACRPCSSGPVPGSNLAVAELTENHEQDVEIASFVE